MAVRANIVQTNEVDDILSRTYVNNLLRVRSWCCVVTKHFGIVLTYLSYCVMVIKYDKRPE